MKYGLSNLGKYWPCRSMGNTMDEYVRYIIKKPRYIHTYKCCHSPPLWAYSITTASPHFKSGLSQWSEPWLSCDDSGSGRSIHSTLIVATLFFVPETNLIFSDISWISSIGWWIPFHCHTRLVWVYSSCQVFNQVRNESCRRKIKMLLTSIFTLQCESSG